MLKKFKVFNLSLLMVFAVGCTTVSQRLEQRRQQGPQSERGETATFEDSKIEVTQSEDPETTWVAEPEVPTPLAPLRVGLILGPGGVKTFAHTGVIKEFVKAKIPIDAIVGLEWGALIAALYADEGKVHSAEWKLYKLESKEFKNQGFFSKKIEPLDVKVMAGFFDKNLSKKDISSLPVDFSCPSLSLLSGTISWQRTGTLPQALSQCLPFPPMFKPTSDWLAASFAVDEAIEFLKKKNINVVVFVNVLADGEPMVATEVKDNFQSALVWQELKRALAKVEGKDVQVVQVNTRRYQLLDFGSARSVFSAGEQAGRKAARELAKKYGF